MDKLLIICGPTATGKTKLAVTIAKQFCGELVSADSRQVYKGMDIGTGKDLGQKFKIQNSKFKMSYRNDTYELYAYSFQGVSLWMYDVVDPDKEFSVSHYQYIARRAVENIWSRGKLPIVVGGTGLYISSLLRPIETTSIPPDNKLRSKFSKVPVEKLQVLVKDQYPDVWLDLNESDRANPRRLIRKLEIQRYKARFQPATTLGNSVIPSLQQLLMVGLTDTYARLYERIDERVDERVKHGIEHEIKELLDNGYTFNLPSFNSFGYKEWRKWFKDPTGRSKEMKDQIIRTWKYDEHGYARRQMTWFKKQLGIHWYNVSEKGIEKKVTRAVQTWYT